MTKRMIIDIGERMIDDGENDYRWKREITKEDVSRKSLSMMKEMVDDKRMIIDVVQEDDP